MDVLKCIDIYMYTHVCGFVCWVAVCCSCCVVLVRLLICVCLSSLSMLVSIDVVLSLACFICCVLAFVVCVLLSM